jgi:preprotein translocase subunit Sss1
VPSPDRLRRPAHDRLRKPGEKEDGMVALLVLLLILAVLGGLGFAAHVIWFVLLVALALWVLGFFVGGVASGGGRRRWYGR